MRTATVRPVLRRLHLIDLPLSMCAEQTLVRLLFKLAPTPSDKSARRSRVLDPQLIKFVIMISEFLSNSSFDQVYLQSTAG